MEMNALASALPDLGPGHPRVPLKESVKAADSAAAATDKRWGVQRRWVHSSRKPPTVCKYGAQCARVGCWFTHPCGSPQAIAEQAARFSAVTWNVQAANTRDDCDASDRSGVEACVAQLLHSTQLRVPGRSKCTADIISLQELQRCPRQIWSGDCRYCAAGQCRYDHASWVMSQMDAAGYDGAVHAHEMKNTVGLFWRRETFELSADHPFYCDFNRPWAVEGRRGGHGKVAMKESRKGAVLALLRQRATGRELLAVAVHPSVPLDTEGHPSAHAPLSEVKQLQKKIESIYARNADRDFPLLVAADLNSTHVATAGCAPPLVYQFLCRTGLRSAVRTVVGREPQLTSVKPGFRHTIDYLLSSDGLRVHGALDAEDTGPRQAAARRRTHCLLRSQRTTVPSSMLG